MKRFTPKALVSLSAAACLLALGVTGLLLYFLKHTTATAAIHTSFGAIFLVIAGLHVRNNSTSEVRGRGRSVSGHRSAGL
jgi:hypothetical protein